MLAEVLLRRVSACYGSHSTAASTCGGQANLKTCRGRSKGRQQMQPTCRSACSKAEMAALDGVAGGLVTTWEGCCCGGWCWCCGAACCRCGPRLLGCRGAAGQLQRTINTHPAPDYASSINERHNSAQQLPSNSSARCAIFAVCGHSTQCQTLLGGLKHKRSCAHRQPASAAGRRAGADGLAPGAAAWARVAAPRTTRHPQTPRSPPRPPHRPTRPGWWKATCGQRGTALTHLN
jgi:hypothetical protein